MEQLETHDIYTDDAVPSNSVNPKKLGSIYVDYKKNKLYICSNNSNNKNVWSIVNPDIVIPEPLKYGLKYEVASFYTFVHGKYTGITIQPNTKYNNPDNSGEVWFIIVNDGIDNFETYGHPNYDLFVYPIKDPDKHTISEPFYTGSGVVPPGYGFKSPIRHNQGLMWLKIKLEQIK